MTPSKGALLWNLERAVRILMPPRVVEEPYRNSSRTDIETNEANYKSVISLGSTNLGDGCFLTVGQSQIKPSPLKLA